MILVPLSSVLYTLALVCFSFAAYYGFRLVQVTRRSRRMIMISHEGPNYVVAGLVVLGLSQVLGIIQSADAVLVALGVVSQVLLMGASFMFAKGFHTMYQIYRNQKIRSEIFDALGEPEESRKVEPEEWHKDLR